MTNAFSTRTALVALAVVLATVAGSCSGASDAPDEASTCAAATELSSVLDRLRHRSSLPTPSQLRSDVEASENLLGVLADGAPADLQGDVATVTAAVEVYGSAVSRADYDLLAAQTQFSTDEQVALYELESDVASSAIDSLDAFAASCAP
ncbi:MAG: hypothetical protein KDB16_03090 [Acidimicrobiales bacterium]|nr:hypothetical protein [Acidimicrobiales bacterium]